MVNGRDRTKAVLFIPRGSVPQQHYRVNDRGTLTARGACSWHGCFQENCYELQITELLTNKKGRSDEFLYLKKTQPISEIRSLEIDVLF